ncbi:hypothetical protein D6Z43_16355 [Pseudomonas sp. DY-1]|uniref:hypothetical protein n=1 Tax=Pseudomonas sp. DY-1 TaxID=1755504 RepID=UPI000EAA60B2|nr:hypothetical protein [Pseudomonas sp. DY-1]AYF88642.1 hypothetical protein D6Z43_16355 [Pseudomonas sp. DY-1]
MSRFSLSDQDLVRLAGQLSLNGTFNHNARSAYSDQVLPFKLKVEQGGAIVSATVLVGGERHTLSLEAADRTKHHTLADFIDAIANGTVDSAEPAPPRIMRQVDEPEPLITSEQAEQLHHLVRYGGAMDLEVGLEHPIRVALHRTYNSPGLTAILSLGWSKPRTSCFTIRGHHTELYKRVMQSAEHLASAGRPQTKAA